MPPRTATLHRTDALRAAATHLSAPQRLQQPVRQTLCGYRAVHFCQSQHREPLIDRRLDYNRRVRREYELRIRKQRRQLRQYGSLPARMKVQVDLINADQRLPGQRIEPDQDGRRRPSWRGPHAILSRDPTVADGEMAEWLKAHAWKACIGETLSRVRIPVSPPDVRPLRSRVLF